MPSSANQTLESRLEQLLIPVYRCGLCPTNILHFHITIRNLIGFMKILDNSRPVFQSSKDLLYVLAPQRPAYTIASTFDSRVTSLKLGAKVRGTGVKLG
jgi:hypothetical protein